MPQEFFHVPRKKDGRFFKSTSMKSIRAVIKRFLHTSSSSPERPSDLLILVAVSLPSQLKKWEMKNFQKFVPQEFFHVREEKGRKFLQKHFIEIDNSRHWPLSSHIQLEYTTEWPVGFATICLANWPVTYWLTDPVWLANRLTNWLKWVKESLSDRVTGRGWLTWLTRMFYLSTELTKGKLATVKRFECWGCEP